MPVELPQRLAHFVDIAEPALRLTPGVVGRHAGVDKLPLRRLEVIRNLGVDIGADPAGLGREADQST